MSGAAQAQQCMVLAPMQSDLGRDTTNEFIEKGKMDKGNSSSVMWFYRVIINIIPRTIT